MAKLYNKLDNEKSITGNAPQAVGRGKTNDTSWDPTTIPTGNGTDYIAGSHPDLSRPDPEDIHVYTQQSATPTKPAPQKWDTTAPASLLGDTSNPELQAAYQSAVQALQDAQGNKPSWNGSQYDAQIQSLYQQIMGQGPFKYDSATDPLYQQYKQDYTTQGQKAMRDTMGQAAALTGGYGSSYAQSVGQQQYGEYLQKLADVLPDTYSAALSAYNAENDRLNNALSTTTSLADTEYQQYLDALSQHNTDLNFLSDQADTAYSHMTDAEDTAWDHQQDLVTEQQNWYNQLYTLMQAGYKPTKADFNRAGLSEAQGIWLWDSIWRET